MSGGVSCHASGLLWRQPWDTVTTRRSVPASWQTLRCSRGTSDGKDRSPWGPTAPRLRHGVVHSVAPVPRIEVPESPSVTRAECRHLVFSHQWRTQNSPGTSSISVEALDSICKRTSSKCGYGPCVGIQPPYKNITRNQRLPTGQGDSDAAISYPSNSISASCFSDT